MALWSNIQQSDTIESSFSIGFDMIHLYNDLNTVTKEITKRGSVLHRCASMPIKLALNGIEDNRGNRFMDLLQRLVPGLAHDIQNESIFTSSKSQYSYVGHISSFPIRMSLWIPG
jgi:hypothetical protein